MTFYSIRFLIFFVIVFIVYYALGSRRTLLQNFLLLIGSYVFYSFADWRMSILLAFVTVVYYFIGISIEHCRELGKNTRHVTAIGIILGIFILLYFKYLNFFIDSFAALINLWGVHVDSFTLNIILPIGISFYTFKLMSYTIEVNRGTMSASRNLINFSTYISFFPTILSGPIDRPNKFLPQLENPRPFDANLAIRGCTQFAWGMFMKLCIADRIGVFINASLPDVANQNGLTIMLGVLLYSIQIYTDFAGYSDMAIGIGKILGFNVTKNFDFPYFSRNVAEFWRKWHISLTSWLRDYIYIPLGGNRNGKQRTIVNTLIVFTICGLWHGSGWNFVLWGFINGLYFIPSLLRKSNKNYKKIPPKICLSDLIKMMFTYIAISCTWVLFRAPSIEVAIQTFAGLFKPWGIPLGGLTLCYILLGLVVLLIHEMHAVFDVFKFLDKIPSYVKVSFFIIMILMFGVFDGNQFIYLKF